MQEHGGKFTVCFQFAYGGYCRACGERYREMRISVVAPAASITAKCEFRWSKFDFALPMLC